MARRVGRGPAVRVALGRRFACRNYGVSNYTTAQEVEFFRDKRALDENPAIVVLEVYTNDFKTSPGRLEVGRLDIHRGRFAYSSGR